MSGERPLPEFHLDLAEQRYLEIIGALRHAENVNRPNGYNLDRDGRDEDVLGVYGEYIVAKWLDRFWCPVVDNPWTELEGDVGRIQVRTTKLREPHLICHDRDPDDAVFVLVSRKAKNHFRVEGWLFGREAKDKQWWGDKFNKKRPAYFVPEHVLYHPADLRA